MPVGATPRRPPARSARIVRPVRYLDSKSVGEIVDGGWEGSCGENNLGLIGSCIKIRVALRLYAMIRKRRKEDKEIS